MGHKNFAVGVFVTVALFAFVATSLWLTGRQGSEPTIDYSMFFAKDVSGLMLGGPVYYLGVEVGTVTAMTIIAGDPVQVRVDIEVLESTPVDTGTFGSLALQGITGVAIINLSADPGVHEPLHRPGDQSNAIIGVRDAGFSALLSKAPHIVDKLDSALERINLLLGEDNRAIVGSILEDIATISGSLAARQESIGEVPVMINETLQEMSAALVKVQSMAGAAEPELLSTLENINQAAEKLATIAGRMEGWANNNDLEMNAFMGDGLGQVPDLVADVRNTFRELEKLVRDLRADPSSVIYKPAENTVEVEQP